MAKEYKEGVDFEWVSAKDGKGNVVKDGKGNPVKTRRFFKKSEKDAMKNPPKKEAPAKPASRPAKAEDKPTARPKPNPARKPGGARPEGKTSGMPAAKPKEGSKAAAAVPVLGVAARVAANRKPATAKPVNPSYTGRAGMAEGFQGRYATEVGRPRAAGGARAIGGNPARRTSGGRILKMPDILELKLMNKGGMVKKSTTPPKTYKK